MVNFHMTPQTPAKTKVIFHHSHIHLAIIQMYSNEKVAIDISFRLLYLAMFGEIAWQQTQK